MVELRKIMVIEKLYLVVYCVCFDIVKVNRVDIGK